MPSAATTEAKPYTLCFAGVKLPEPYQTSFVRVSDEAAKLFPGIRLMHPRVAGHITAAYLGDVDSVDLTMISRVIAEYSHHLVGERLILEGLNITSRKFGFRAMVDVAAPDAWYRFVELVNQGLESMTAKNLTGFTKIPHVTIGNKKYERGVNRVATEFNQRLFAERARRMQGSFPLTELKVWGMDIEDPTRTQVVRQTIPIGVRAKRFYYGASLQGRQSA